MTREEQLRPTLLADAQLPIFSAIGHISQKTRPCVSHFKQGRFSSGVF